MAFACVRIHVTIGFAGQKRQSHAVVAKYDSNLLLALLLVLYELALGGIHSCFYFSCGGGGGKSAVPSDPISELKKQFCIIYFRSNCINRYRIQIS